MAGKMIRCEEYPPLHDCQNVGHQATSVKVKEFCGVKQF